MRKITTPCSSWASCHHFLKIIPMTDRMDVGGGGERSCFSFYLAMGSFPGKASTLTWRRQLRPSHHAMGGMATTTQQPSVVIPQVDLLAGRKETGERGQQNERRRTHQMSAKKRSAICRVLLLRKDSRVKSTSCYLRLIFCLGWNSFTSWGWHATVISHPKLSPWAAQP